MNITKVKYCVKTEGKQETLHEKLPEAKEYALFLKNKGHPCSIVRLVSVTSEEFLYSYGVK